MKLANVRKIAGADSAQLTLSEGGYGDSLTSKRDKLDFVGFAVAMDVHNCSHVSGLQTLGGKVFGENDCVVFVNHVFLGYAVTSFGATAPRSRCHTVQTSRSVPSAARSGPATT